jgi:thiamine biosynthesis lipoprotein
MGVAESTFPAMGGTARVVLVDAPADLLAAVRERLAQLEARWSRFLPESEVSRVNRAQGVPVLVSSDTVLLFERAREAWERTAGRFDPTVYDAIMRLGYTASFDTLRAVVPAAPAPRTRAPGCGAFVIDRVVGSVRVPAGARFDPGGIGKGLAADLVAEECMARGASGALVSLGGDLRVIGRRPDGADAWSIAVEDPDDGALAVASVTVADGGVATTSRRSKRWVYGSEAVHHVLDPATGLPASGPRSVTVVASSVWLAEAFATAALVAGDCATDVLRAAELPGVVVYDDTRVEIAA